MATEAAPFSPRYDHTTVVFDDRMWVIGGYDEKHQFKNDVWHSSDGKKWTRATGNAAFSPRLGHTSFVYHDMMWVIGGEITERPWIFTNDVWYSSDGTNWHQATESAPFSPRFAHCAAVTTPLFNDKMWVISGVEDAYGKSINNEVWYSSDGEEWHQVDDSIRFSPRYVSDLAVNGETLYLTGGYDGVSNLNETWVSHDGRTWELDTSATKFFPRMGHGSLVFSNKLWVIGGQNVNNVYFNDVWHTAEITAMPPGSKVSVKKTVSPWSVKQGTDTRITISYTNAGSAPVHDIEILDTVPEEFLLISGEPGISVPQSLMPNETRILVYTIRATRPGVYALPRTSVLYAADDGNYYKTSSNAPEVKVIAPLIADDAPSGNEPISFLDELWQEITTFFSM